MRELPEVPRGKYAPYAPLTKDGARLIEAQKLILQRERERATRLLDSPDDEIRSPIPGLVLGLPVAILVWIGIIALARLFLAAIGVIR